jgi:tetratricopeptide (TPR) repeat protein
VTAAQWITIGAIALPALALALWPLVHGRAGRGTVPSSAPPDRRLELAEEKASTYRALKELAFDHESGALSDDDFEALRDRYEARAAELVTALDALGPAAPAAASERAAAAPQSWTRRPAGVVAGAVGLLVLGIALGVGVGRYAQPDEAAMPPGGRPPVPAPPGPGPVMPGLAGMGADAGAPIPPEIMARMLEAARESLVAGRYPEAIQAYQAVLKRDGKNVDAMTHLGLIVAMGGHADAALETFDKALRLDPKFGPALLYKGQVLYEVKRDYPGAIQAWERFLALAPSGEDRQRVTALIQEARTKAAVRR